MMWKNISIKGGFVETRNIPELVKLVQAQKISVRFLITHKLPLKEAVRGYELMDKRLENVLKVALVPHP